MRRNLAALDRNTWSPLGRLLQEAMAHGIENDMIFGGLIAGQSEMQGLHVVQTAQNCLIATRRVTWDGRVYRYSKSVAACWTWMGNIYARAVGNHGIDYSAVPVTSAIGATSIVMTNQGVRAVVADDMLNGNLVLKITDGADNTNVQSRNITGNTADASVGHDGTVVISFAEPLTFAMTATLSYAYAMPSPYSGIEYTANEGIGGNCGHVGYAAAYCNAADLFHWEQVWGKCHASLQGSPGETTHERGLVWRYDGNLQIQGTTPILGLNQQAAGFIMDDNRSLNGCTLVCLQGDK